MDEAWLGKPAGKGSRGPEAPAQYGHRSDRGSGVTGLADRPRRAPAPPGTRIISAPSPVRSRANPSPRFDRAAPLPWRDWEPVGPEPYPRRPSFSLQRGQRWVSRVPRFKEMLDTADDDTRSQAATCENSDHAIPFTDLDATPGGTLWQDLAADLTPLRGARAVRCGRSTLPL